MKFRFLYTLMGLAALAFLITSNSGGRATAADSGNTGAPGDAGSTCITCHNTSSAIQISIGLELTDGNGNVVTDNYNSGETYDAKVTVNVDQGSVNGFGFQMVCLNGELNENTTDVPNWTELSDNTQMTKVSNGRTYVEHDGTSDSNEFTMKWTAPDNGAVTFYVCGNGVNRNGGTSGDGAGCTTLTLTNSSTVSTNNLAKELGMTLSPNPAVDFTMLTTKLSEAERFELRLTDAQGRLLRNENMLIPAGANRQEIDVNDLPSGIYYLQLTNGQKVATQKLLKL